MGTAALPAAATNARPSGALTTPDTAKAFSKDRTTRGAAATTRIRGTTSIAMPTMATGGGPSTATCTAGRSVRAFRPATASRSTATRGTTTIPAAFRIPARAELPIPAARCARRPRRWDTATAWKPAATTRAITTATTRSGRSAIAKATTTTTAATVLATNTRANTAPRSSKVTARVTTGRGNTRIGKWVNWQFGNSTYPFTNLQTYQFSE